MEESSSISREFVSDFSCDELCDYLVDKNVHGDVIFTVRENFLVGRDFLELTEDLLKELFPVVGSRLAVSRIVKSLKHVCQSSSTMSTLSGRSFDSQVPSVQSRWITTFEIPDTFTRKTTKAIRLGVPTKPARIEIINALHSRMLQYTTRPTSFEYKKACERLVPKHKKLQDRTASKYGTWKEQLKQKFRNGRRQEPQDREQEQTVLSQNNSTNSDHESQPKPKKRKTAKRVASNIDDSVPADLEPLDDYEEKVQQLKEEVLASGSAKVSNRRVKNLMRGTFSRRRHWILSDRPKVCEVLKVFPHLQVPSRLRDDFNMILKLEKSHDFFKDWSTWEEKIFGLADLEVGNVRIKELLDEYRMCLSSNDEECSENIKVFHAISLLTVILAPRAKSKVLYEYPDTVDLDTTVTQLPPAPSIVIVHSDSGTQYYIAVEKQVLLESEDMRGAVIDMFAAYFTFDIMYPKPLYPVYIFLQHQMLGIADSQIIPNIVTITLSSMANLNL